MQARITNCAVLVVLAIASVVSYVNDLDILVAAFQVMSLMVFKKITYDRSAENNSGRSAVIDIRTRGT
jgi:hypothetical protein